MWSSSATFSWGTVFGCKKTTWWQASFAPPVSTTRGLSCYHAILLFHKWWCFLLFRYSTHWKLTYPTLGERKSYLCGTMWRVSISTTCQFHTMTFGMVIQRDLLRGEKWPPRIGDKSRPRIESPEPIAKPPSFSPRPVSGKRFPMDRLRSRGRFVETNWIRLGLIVILEPNPPQDNCLRWGTWVGFLIWPCKRKTFVGCFG